LLAAIAAASLGACGGHAATSSLPVGGTSTLPPTAPPTTGIATSTAVTAPGTPQPSPAQAADTLLAAWRRGDRNAALQVASAVAVTELFGHAAAPPQSRGCQDAIASASDCAFGVNGSLLTLHTVEVPAGWVVEGVTYLS
jgi:hypothetical protein